MNAITLKRSRNFIINQVGHVDFYPNSGMAPQPGCKGEPIGLDCSHQRANVRQISFLSFVVARHLGWKNNLIVKHIVFNFYSFQKLYDRSDLQQGTPILKLAEFKQL